VKAVRHFVLILEEPIDIGFVVHRFVDRLGGRGAMRFEQDLEIDFLRHDAGIKPDRHDDAQVVGLGLRDISGATESNTPLAIAACTVPIRMFVYLVFLTVTLLTINVTGRTCTSQFRIANTRE